MELSGHITDLITVATEMKKSPNADKKALNKTIARLEEAELWSRQVSLGRVNGVPTASAALQGNAGVTCTCPNGVTDQNCPTHGSKN